MGDGTDGGCIAPPPPAITGQCNKTPWWGNLGKATSRALRACAAIGGKLVIRVLEQGQDTRVKDWRKSPQMGYKSAGLCR